MRQSGIAARGWIIWSFGLLKLPQWSYQSLGAGHIMTFLRYFLFVLGAAILAAIVGGVFAAVVALISPEFVKTCFHPPKAHHYHATRRRWGRSGECSLAQA